MNMHKIRILAGTLAGVFCLSAQAAEAIACGPLGANGVRDASGSFVRVKVGDSLNDAVARARTLPKPVTLRLEPGVHELSDTLRLGPEDSGLVFESASGAQAILSGGRRVAGWSRNEDGTWRTDVPKGRPFHQLTVNGARAARCRHPNTGCFMAAGEEIPFVTNSVTPSAGGRRHPALVYDPKDIDFAALARPDTAEIRVFHWWVDSHLTIACSTGGLTRT